MDALIWGMLFGAIGMGFIVYGKNEHRTIPLGCGVTLCILPYIVTNVFIMIIVAVVLIALPYFLRY